MGRNHYSNRYRIFELEIYYLRHRAHNVLKVLPDERLSTVNCVEVRGIAHCGVL